MKIRHPQRDVLLEADVGRLFSVAAAGRTATAGMTDPSGGMSNPSGGMGNPSAGMTNPPARMSSTPMMPTIAAAPTDAGSEVLVAPVPAGAVPTVVIPAVIVTEPDELRALNYIQAIGRSSNRSSHRGCTDTGPHDRRTANEDGCGRNRHSEPMHNDFPFLHRPRFYYASEMLSDIDANQLCPVPDITTRPEH